LETIFSGEEGFGKYLDLHALHEQYLNLKHIRKITYLSYLSTFDSFTEVPKEAKNKDYIKYAFLFITKKNIYNSI
jgi:splicing factor 3A subunit 3